MLIGLFLLAAVAVQVYFSTFFLTEETMKGFTLIELAIVIVIAALLAAVAVPIYNGIVADSKWSEAKNAVGTIKAAVDPYKAAKGGELAALSAAAGFAPTSALLTELKLADDAFSTLQYFDAADFSMTVVDNVSPIADTYTVTCTAVAGGGQSLNGPGGTGTYTSATGQYTGNLQ